MASLAGPCQAKVYLFGHNEVVFSAHDRRLADDVAFAHVLQKVCPLCSVPKARVRTVQQILARWGQIGVEEQPKPLRRRAVGGMKGVGMQIRSDAARNEQIYTLKYICVNVQQHKRKQERILTR